MADVTTAEKYIRNAELQGMYKKTEATDAQELTTVREHLKVMYHSGQIPGDVYKAMMVIVEAGERAPGGYYEFTDPEHVKIVMQPMKPVYVGTRPNDRGVEFHDYIKSSSYALYPPMTRDVDGAPFEIDHLRRTMENKGNPNGSIDRANFASAQKLGLPNNPTVVFNTDGTFNQGVVFKEDWENSTQTLERRYFRIQQEVPYDADKDAIKTITQMNRLLTESIEQVNKPFKVPNMEDPITGEQLRAAKEAIRNKLINRNVDRFYKKTGVGRTPGGMKILNKDKIIEALISEARKNNFSANEVSHLLHMTSVTNEIDDLGHPIRGKNELEIPLMFTTGVEKFEKLLMNMVKKIAEVKMPGKSYIQASSIGYIQCKDFIGTEDLAEGERAGIVMLDGFSLNEPLRTMSQDDEGNTIPAQVLAPFNFMIAEPDGRKIRAKISDFLQNDDNRRKALDMERVPKELLQLVGARVPNQGHNSMLAIEIVGFIPDSMGDLMVVPSAITKQMGSHFSVDKLFIYKRAYCYKDGKFTIDCFDPNALLTKKNVVGDEVMETESELKNRYFDLHWAVLSHPEMYNKVLTPIDKPDMKEEAEILVPRLKPYNNFFHVGTQLRNFKYGNRAKHLIALTTLSVTFNTVIQNKSLRMGTLEPVMNADGKYTGDMKEVPKYISLNGFALTHLSGYGSSTYTYTTKDGIVVTEKRSKGDNLAILQSAALDNTTLHYLDNLNLTPDTFAAAAAMLMLETSEGKSLDISYVTHMMTQIAVQEYSKFMASSNDSLSDKYVNDVQSNSAKKVHQWIEGQWEARQTFTAQEKGQSDKDFAAWKADILVDRRKIFHQKAADFLVSPESMLKEFNRPSAVGQLAIFNLFIEFNSVGERIAELQSLFNQETKGGGQTIFMAKNKNNIFQKLGKATGILGEKSIYADEKGKLTEQGNTYDATIGTALDVLTKVLPYHKLNAVIDTVKRETNKPQISIKVQLQLLRNLRSYVYSGIHSMWPDASNERFRLLYNIHGKSLATRLTEAKSTWGKDNFFLLRLLPEPGSLSNGPDYINFNSAKAETLDDNLNVVAFLGLLSSGDRDQRLLAEDLVRYAYLTGGQQDLNSFVSKVPVAYIMATDFAAQLRAAQEKLEVIANSDGFLLQFFQHNPETAIQIGDEFLKPFLKKEGRLAENYPPTFVVDPENPVFALLKTVDGDGKPKLVDFVHHRSKKEGKIILYMRRDFTYLNIDTLGNSHTDEFNGSAKFAVRSIFQENRTLVDNITGVKKEGMAEE